MKQSTLLFIAAKVSQKIVVTQQTGCGANKVGPDTKIAPSTNLCSCKGRFILEEATCEVDVTHGYRRKRANFKRFVDSMTNCRPFPLYVCFVKINLSELDLNLQQAFAENEYCFRAMRLLFLFKSYEDFNKSVTCSQFQQNVTIFCTPGLHTYVIIYSNQTQTLLLICLSFVKIFIS